MKFNPQTTAFVFPGQGSQAVGMGKNLAAQYPASQQIFDEADAILGFSGANRDSLDPFMPEASGGGHRH